MKGIVFTEFLDFVESRFGADMVDDVIEDAQPANGGAYTSVGTYPHTDMSALVGALSRRVDAAAPDLVRAFGSHLCARFVVKFPGFFAAATGLFDFLASVDGHIHVEVRKLYPDAELPTFEVSARSPQSIDLTYASCRPFETLAEGMILGAAAHFGEAVEIAKIRIATSGGDATRFSISRAVGALAA